MASHYANAGALVPYVHPEVKEAPMPQALRERLTEWKRERIGRSLEQIKGAAWSSIPEATRCELLAVCTDRPTQDAERLRWSDLTLTERAAIGAKSRGLVRDLGRAAGYLVP